MEMILWLERLGRKALRNPFELSIAVILAAGSLASTLNLGPLPGILMFFAMIGSWIFIAKPGIYSDVLRIEQVHVANGNWTWVIPEEVHLQGKKVIAFTKDSKGNTYTDEPQVDPGTGRVEVSVPSNLDEPRYITIIGV